MTFDERIHAIAKIGFTEGLARFLVTVMLHAGVCVPRQYAAFCGIVHGQNTRKLFAKLVRLGYASMHDCRHNRAQLYHLHSKALDRTIDDAESRLRRPPTLGHAIQRPMVLCSTCGRTPVKRLGPARPAAVGYINGTRPAVDVAASCTPADFDYIWSLALSGHLTHAYMSFTKPHYNSASVLSMSFSNELEE